MTSQILTKTVLTVAAVANALLAASTNAATITAYYDFEGTGADIYDDPAGVPDDLTGGQAGKAVSNDTPGAFAGTQSASFDGNNTKIWTGAYSTDLTSTNTYTAMFWIKARDIDQENTATRLMNVRVKADTTSATNPAWSIEGFGNPTTGANGDRMDLRKYSTVQGGGGFTPTATNALARADQGESLAVWRHVAYIVSNSGYPDDASNDAYTATFVDGVRIGLDRETAQNGIGIGNTDGVLIIGGGENFGDGGRDFTGLLDDVALFAGAVDDADILAIARGEMSPGDFIAGPVPEPTTLALASLSLLGLVGQRRRRR